MSPRDTVRMPPGPSKTAVPLATSRSVHPSIVVGLVSGVAVSLTRDCGSLAIDEVAGAALTGDFAWLFADEEEMFEFCGSCVEDGPAA